MACKQPTSQQLAYLDELKQRLQELRVRQETFMEETAEILRNIKPDCPTPTNEDPVFITPEESRSAEEIAESSGNIKQLIQRFEDLRKTSRQFRDQPMPDELVNVDVRKLLKGYEKLIVEGDILQDSWLLLKKTTESCARLKQSAGLCHKKHSKGFKSNYDRSCMEAATQTYGVRYKRSLQFKDTATRPRVGSLLQSLLRNLFFGKHKG